MFDAYKRIFTRLGLEFRAVAADTGAIGGDAQPRVPGHRRHGRGPHRLVPGLRLRRQYRTRQAVPLIARRAAPAQELRKNPHTGHHTLRGRRDSARRADRDNGQVSRTGDAEKEGKTELWLLMLRGDHELNEVKASKLPGLSEGFRFATEAEIVEHFGCVPGYLGPIGLKKPLHIVADLTVANMSDFV
jgi:prolyl-tRNA synthetase